MNRVLRILEPTFFVMGLVWAFLILLVRDAGTASYGVRAAALIALAVVGLIPFFVVSLMYRRSRAKAAASGQIVAESPFSKMFVWGAVLCIAIVALIALLSPMREERAPIANQAEPKTGFWEFISEPYRMIVTLSDEWEEVPFEQNLALPKDLTGAQFAFQKKNTSCVLAYISASEDAFKYYPSYPQFGWPLNFTASNRNLKRDFKVHFGTHKDNYEFIKAAVDRGETPPNMQSEGAFISYYNPLQQSKKTNAFVLFASDDNLPLVESCFKDYSDILAMLRILHEPITLTSESEGALYIASEKIKGRNVDQVRFIPQGSTTSYAVMSMNAGSVPLPQVVDGKLYVIVDRGLHELDPFKKTTTNVLDTTFAGEESVQGFVITKDKIFYIAGPYCLGYMDTCNMSLYEYDRTRQRSTKRADGLPYREIVGYDEQAGEILLAYRDGDAGCRWGQTGIYREATESIEETHKYSACHENERLLGEYAAAEADIERFKEEVPTYNNIRIQAGQSTMPTAPLPQDEYRWAIAYP